MGIKEEIKGLIYSAGESMASVCRKMTAITGKKCSTENISQKLRNETIKYAEIKLIAEIIGYEVKILPKEK